MSRKTKKAASIEKRIANIIHDQFGHMLADVDFRIQQAYAITERSGGRNGKVYAEDLNLIGRHMLTGYTTTANTPSAGFVSWSNLHMVYNGVDNTITDGNSNAKYLYWSPSTATVLKTSATKPALAAGEVLLFVNNSGTPTLMLSDTNSSLPVLVADNSITNNEILGKTITTAELGNLSVDDTILKGNAVVAGKIANGAVNNSLIFTTGVVNNAAVGTGAVSAAKLNILRHVMY